MDISNLTPEEKKQLYAQLEKDKQEESQRIQGERDTYKVLTEEFINRNYTLLMFMRGA